MIETHWPTRLLRIVYTALSVGCTAVGAWGAASLLNSGLHGSEGQAALTVFLLVIFTVLFGWICTNFWIAVVGFCGALWHKLPRRMALDPTDDRAFRTAIVIPIYNEDVDRVSAGVRSMLASLQRCGWLDHFDIFLLSDSTDPDIWLREQKAWAEFCRVAAYRNKVYYRRRTRNEERKSGNIKEFLERFGAGYRYMLVLDADSLMDGRTMAEMVRRMERNPRLGLLQTWPQVMGETTLFARMQQFSSWVYGRPLAYGMALIFGAQGNYWGHNAIIRISAFIESCGLPRLPGKEPLGGEILSHDFVEAALLIRRGWEVRLDPDLAGSFEEVPTNLVRNLVRDRRWCQGNLQHGWLLISKGFHPMSRMTFLTGIMAYATAPLWLLFVVTSVAFVGLRDIMFEADLSMTMGPGEVWTIRPVWGEEVLSYALLGTTLIFLFGPKVLGMLLAAMDAPLRLFQVVLGVVAETVLSVLQAPIVMIRHSQFVACLLVGRGVSWDAQQRDVDRLRWTEALRSNWDVTLLGLLLVGAAYLWAQSALLWVSPIATGLILSVPLSVLTAHGGIGRAMGGLGLFATPTEWSPTLLVRHFRQIRAQAQPARERSLLEEIIEDPFLYTLHRFVTLDTAVGGSLSIDIAPSNENSDIRRLLSSPAALRRQHLSHWAKGPSCELPFPGDEEVS